MLEDIKSQGCDVVPVGHHDSKDNDIQWPWKVRQNKRQHNLHCHVSVTVEGC
jgi:hypothetical protein